MENDVLEKSSLITCTDSWKDKQQESSLSASTLLAWLCKKTGSRVCVERHMSTRCHQLPLNHFKGLPPPTRATQYSSTSWQMSRGSHNDHSILLLLLRNWPGAAAHDGKGQICRAPGVPQIWTITAGAGQAISDEMTSYWKKKPCRFGERIWIFWWTKVAEAAEVTASRHASLCPSSRNTANSALGKWKWESPALTLCQGQKAGTPEHSWAGIVQGLVREEHQGNPLWAVALTCSSQNTQTFPWRVSVWKQPDLLSLPLKQWDRFPSMMLVLSPAANQT